LSEIHIANELCRLSAVELKERYRSKTLSPVEVMQAVLLRADHLNPHLNCCLTICHELALNGARQAEARIMSGEAYPPLTGIPYSAKDLINTKGIRTTYGALPFKDNVPISDALVISRLRDAGAILFAKTTTPEFGTAGVTESPLFGKTRNAWSADRTSGGSSGGAAVAVASGIGPLALATDGGGSTRIPAACNGLVGIKQSSGIVPHSQVVDKFGNQTYVTPMTRTVADTALMLDAIAGEDECDPTSMGLRREDYYGAATRVSDLKGVKILYCLAPVGLPISDDVQTGFHKALNSLSELGTQIEPFNPAGLNVLTTWQVINHTVWLTRFKALADQYPTQLSPTFLKQLESAKKFSAIDYQDAMIARSQLYAQVQELVQPGHFLAMPTLSRTALPINIDFLGSFDIDGQSFDEIRANWYPWTMLFNMTGHPAISLPCGFGRDGLPIGLQLVGQYRKDAALLGLAAAFERSQNFTHLWPAEAVFI
jgi:aspartyl-tRNA(Asn)/glutamyl-tRNA(Gln) amidotransferase subunit A